MNKRNETHKDNDQLPSARDLSDVEINSMCDDLIGVVGGTAWDSDYCKNMNAVARLWKHVDGLPKSDRSIVLTTMLALA